MATLERLLRAAGFTAAATLRPVPEDDEQDRTQKIEALFAFTNVLPRGERGPLTFPVFRTPKTTAR